MNQVFPGTTLEYETFIFNIQGGVTIEKYFWSLFYRHPVCK